MLKMAESVIESLLAKKKKRGEEPRPSTSIPRLGNFLHSPGFAHLKRRKIVVRGLEFPIWRW